MKVGKLLGNQTKQQKLAKQYEHVVSIGNDICKILMKLDKRRSQIDGSEDLMSKLKLPHPRQA